MVRSLWKDGLVFEFFFDVYFVAILFCQYCLIIMTGTVYTGNVMR